MCGPGGESLRCNGALWLLAKRRRHMLQAGRGGEGGEAEAYQPHQACCPCLAPPYPLVAPPPTNAPAPM